MHESIRHALKTHPFSVERSPDMILIAKAFVEAVEKNVTNIIPTDDHSDTLANPLKHKRLRSKIRLTFKEMQHHCINAKINLFPKRRAMMEKAFLSITRATESASNILHAFEAFLDAVGGYDERIQPAMELAYRFEIQSAVALADLYAANTVEIPGYYRNWKVGDKYHIPSGTIEVGDGLVARLTAGSKGTPLLPIPGLRQIDSVHFAKILYGWRLRSDEPLTAEHFDLELAIDGKSYFDPVANSLASIPLWYIAKANEHPTAKIVHTGGMWMVVSKVDAATFPIIVNCELTCPGSNEHHLYF